MKKYDNSRHKLLSTIYPNYEWLPWQFEKATHFFESSENQKKWIDWAKTQLNVRDMNDWYQITSQVYYSPFI